MVIANSCEGCFPNVCVVYFHPVTVNADGTRAGMTAEGVQAAAKSTKQLSLQEAQMILGVESQATWEEIMKKYNHLFAANEKHGSFYLQSKVYRAKERLEEEFREKGWDTSEPEGQQTQSESSR